MTTDIIEAARAAGVHPLAMSEEYIGGLERFAAVFREEAAAELRRLHADAEENEALRERLSELLRNTAVALRGPEPELTRWSWHDLPELAAALKAQRDETLDTLKGAELVLAEKMRRLGADPNVSPMTHRIRAAIKAVEGETK